METKKAGFKRVNNNYYIAAEVDDFLNILKTNYQELYEEAQEQRLELNRVLEMNQRLKQEQQELQKKLETIDLKQLRTEQCASLLDAAGRTADAYVKEVEQKMEALLSETKDKTQAQLDQAKIQSTVIVREARENADAIQREAESRVADILAAGRRELTRIQLFVEESKQEYTKLLESRKENGLL